MIRTPSVATQMLWAYWRQGAGFIFGLPWGIVLIFSLFTLASGGAEFLAERLVREFSFLISLALVTAVVIPATSFDSRSFRFKQSLYTMPVSTARLVAIQMGCVLFTYVVLVILVAAMLYVLVFGALMYPAPEGTNPTGSLIFSLNLVFLYGLTLCPILLAVIWSSPEDGKPILVVVALAIFFFNLHPLIFENSVPILMWPIPLILILLGYAVSVIGVSWDRSGGNSRPSFWSSPFLVSVFSGNSSRAKFKSPAHAQFWFEWRQKGLALPFVVASLLGGTLLVWVANAFSTEMDVNLHWGFLGVFVSLCLYAIPAGAFVIGLLIGQVNARQKPYISPFLATRPMTDSALSKSILKVGTLSLILSYAIAAIFFLALISFLYLIGMRELLQKAFNYLDWETEVVAELFGWTAILIVLAWAAISLGSSLAMTGRSWLIFSISFSPFLLFLVAILGDLLDIEGFIEDFYGKAVFWSVIAAIILGNLLAHYQAVRERHLGPSFSTAALAVWLIITAATWAWFFFNGHAPAFIYVFTAAFFALPTAAFAVAPLALAWNRHR